MNDTIHIPVLLDEVLDHLAPQSGDDYLDLTAGYGGHASQIGDKLGENGTMTLVDRDSRSIDELAGKFGKQSNVQILHMDYLQASQQLSDQGRQFDCILADIGVSSPHLDNPDRGFSFMNDGPLDMRMDNEQELTASEIVNTYDEERLANVLYAYGELHNSRQLARAIVAHRPFVTTHELASVIKGTHKTRMRLLAQVFQALRIEVNDELEQLKSALPLWHRLLRPGGRLGVITFHSLEDRIVKQYVKEYGGDRLDSELTIITKHPVVGSESEVVFNPRARSAKLRVVQRK